MRLGLVTLTALCLLGSVVLACAGADADDTTYTRTTVVDSGNRLRFVLQPSDNTQTCARLDDAGTTPVLATRSDARIVADTYYESDGGSFGYVFWVIDRSGTHSVFRAHYYLQNCALSERRYDQAYFDGADRYLLASQQYRTTLRENLAR